MNLLILCKCYVSHKIVSWIEATGYKSTAFDFPGVYRTVENLTLSRRVQRVENRINGLFIGSTRSHIIVCHEMTSHHTGRDNLKSCVDSDNYSNMQWGISPPVRRFVVLGWRCDTTLNYCTSNKSFDFPLQHMPIRAYMSCMVVGSNGCIASLRLYFHWQSRYRSWRPLREYRANYSGIIQ